MSPDRTGRSEPPAPLLIASNTPPAFDVSVVVVTWNSARWIGRCLESIPQACGDCSYEVVVWDNSSTDDTLGVVDELERRIVGGAHHEGRVAARLIPSTENHGFAGGMNRAIAETRGKYIFLLNPDVELSPRALSELHDFLEQHPRVAAAAPLMDDEVGDSQREFQLRRFPTLVTFAFDILAVSRLFPNNRVTARYRYRDLDLSHPQRVEQPAAAALLVRREAFEAAGAFDERFSPAWFEDVDYCRRLAALGLEIWVVPSALVRHVGGASLEHLSFEEFNDAWYENMWRYAAKWFSPGRAEALRWVVIAGMIARFVAVGAGLAHRDIGRRRAFAAFGKVLRRAFDRWSR